MMRSPPPIDPAERRVSNALAALVLLLALPAVIRLLEHIR